MKTLQVHVGEVKWLYMTLKDKNNTVIDLTSSNVWLKYGYGQDLENSVSRLCTIVSATAGTIKYKTTASDFTEESDCPALIQIDYLDGTTVVLEDYMIEVLRNIGG